MGWIESRLRLAESSIEDLYRRILDQLATLNMVRQQLRAQGQQMPAAAPPATGGGAYVCMSPSAINGVWSGSTPTSPGSFQTTVYQVQGTTVTSMGTKSCYNWMPAATVANKACNLQPDGQGHYVIISQSCT